MGPNFGGIKLDANVCNSGGFPLNTVDAGDIMVNMSLFTGFPTGWVVVSDFLTINSSALFGLVGPSS